jgi:hypothetical protein
MRKQLLRCKQQRGNYVTCRHPSLFDAMIDLTQAAARRYVRRLVAISVWPPHGKIYNGLVDAYLRRQLLVMAGKFRFALVKVFASVVDMQGRRRPVQFASSAVMARHMLPSRRKRCPMRVGCAFMLCMQAPFCKESVADSVGFVDDTISKGSAKCPVTTAAQLLDAVFPHARSSSATN